MAPFTHTSTDRPSRFSTGKRGVLYVASDFDTAVHETIHHHTVFMKATDEPAGWTSQFRELVMTVTAPLHDIRKLDARALLDPEDYSQSQAFGDALRDVNGQGIVYPSVRGAGDCVGLFYPDLTGAPQQGRHLDYHWNGDTVDLVRDASSDTVYRVLNA